MEKVSVIVPVFNGNRFLAATLRSIASQTLPPWEIIVVDDCSTHDTQACVAAALPDAVFLRNSRNGGVCITRNVGIRASSGVMIALSDQDDIWHPEKLERQAAAMRGNPDVDFLFTNFTYLRGDSLDATDKFAQAPARYWHDITEARDGDVVRLRHPALPKLLEFQPVFPSTVVIRRALLDRAGMFDEALGREQSEDLEFLLRCDSVCKIAAIATSLVTVRRHGGNYSENTTQTTLSQVRILRRMLAADERYAPYRALIEREVISRSINVFNGAFAAGDLALCREILTTIPFARRDAKLNVKAAVTAMPGPLARSLQALLVG